MTTETTRRWFIGGTNTEVGKSVVTCCLVRAARNMGYDAGLLKPVSSGVVETDRGPVAADYAFYAEVLENLDEPELVTPVVYRDPYAPTVAERRQYPDGGGPDILAEVDRAWGELSRRHELMFVEGIGGMLVPLPGELYVADLVRRLHCPLVLVADVGLGTINHCLLTLEAMARRDIEVSGIVMNGRGSIGSIPELTNPDEVARFGDVEVLSVFDRCEGMTPAGLVEHLSVRAETVVQRLVSSSAECGVRSGES